MNNKDAMKNIIDKLKLASHKLEEGELAAAFELIEEMQVAIEKEKSKLDTLIEKRKETDSLQNLIDMHSSFKRKLLKEMAKNL